MSRTLVSILSDHLLPNFLLIKEMEGRFDDLLFISTRQMEERCMSGLLEEALNLEEGSVRCLVVENDDYNAVLETLRNAKPDDTSEFIVNVTGGTKTMSIAVHEFFRNFSARFYYVPIGANTYYDFTTGALSAINYRVNLDEYFALYGLAFEWDNGLLRGEKEPFKIFDRQKRRNFCLSKDLRNAHMQKEPEMRRYLSGEWFEEYAYLRLKQEFNLRDQDIAKSVKIYRDESNNNDNELDVAFVKDNALYVIECKVSMTGYGKDPKDVIEEYLYKLAAISKDFGLRVNSYIFTLHQMNLLQTDARQNLEKRMRILGIRGIIAGNKLTKSLPL